MLFLDQVLLYYKRQMCEHPPYWTLGFLLSLPPFLHLHTIWTLSLSGTNSFLSAARWFWANKETWSKNKRRILFCLSRKATEAQSCYMVSGKLKVKSVPFQDEVPALHLAAADSSWGMCQCGSVCLLKSRDPSLSRSNFKWAPSYYENHSCHIFISKFL